MIGVDQAGLVVLVIEVAQAIEAVHIIEVVPVTAIVIFLEKFMSNSKNLFLKIFILFH